MQDKEKRTIKELYFESNYNATNTDSKRFISGRTLGKYKGVNVFAFPFKYEVLIVYDKLSYITSLDDTLDFELIELAWKRKRDKEIKKFEFKKFFVEEINK